MASPSDKRVSTVRDSLHAAGLVANADDEYMHNLFGRLVPPGPGLIIGAISVVATIMYFLWEGGPFHASRTVERVYLGMALLMLTIAVYMGRFPAYDERAWSVIHLTHMMVMLSAIHIYLQHIRVRPARAFYDENDRRPFACRAKASTLALRIVKELDDSLQKVVKKDPSCFLLHKKAFPFTTLILTMGVQACTNFHTVAKVTLATSIGLQVVVGLVSIMHIIKSMVKRRSVARRLDDIVTALVAQNDAILLSDVLRSINVPSLLEVSPWIVWEQLAVEALDRNLLDTSSKALLVNAIQKFGFNRFSFFDAAEKIKSLICSCEGNELTELKNMLDSTGDYCNVFKLLYVDIHKCNIQEDILKHLASQARILRGPENQRIGVKVLSDIDDTLVCSGGKFPAGCDRRLPGGMLYPGCLRLFRELDGSWQADKPSSNIVFLSARPHIYKDVLEHASLGKFRDLFDQGKLHTMPSLLTGSLRLGILAAVKSLCFRSRSWNQVGEKKVLVFQQYVQLYGEYDFVFFGDNGQGDLLAGQLMMGFQRGDAVTPNAAEAFSTCKPRVLAVVIHEVLPLEECLSLELHAERNANWRTQLAQDGIYFHKTYVSAAISLVEARLLSIYQLIDVVISARTDFISAHAMFPERQDDWGLMDDDLRADLTRANQVIIEAGLLPVEDLPPAHTLQRGDTALMYVASKLSKTPSRGRLWHEASSSSSSGSDSESHGAGRVGLRANMPSVPSLMNLMQFDDSDDDTWV